MERTIPTSTSSNSVLQFPTPPKAMSGAEPAHPQVPYDDTPSWNSPTSVFMGTSGRLSSSSGSETSEASEETTVQQMEHVALAGPIRACNASKPLLNFSPGPAPLPATVLEEIQAELLNWRGTGSSVLCMSHRSPEFGVIYAETVASIKALLRVPSTHEVIFTHGGGHGQFAAVPLNLAAEGAKVDYLVSGTWSKRAAAEASKWCSVREICPQGDAASTGLPPRDEWVLDPEASYRYICSNETINGTEFHRMPEFDDGVPLVVDMSSDIASKALDWDRIGVAFACAPKNIGHAGLTVVIIRRDLITERTAQATCPGVLNWRTTCESGGMWNTPPTFNIYTTGKVMDWMIAEGGIDEMESRAIRKSNAVMDVVDESGGFYNTPCQVKADRSRMNVPFDVCGGDEKATEAFLIGAYELNMVGFRTKTPFGYGKYLRASFYTGTNVEQADTLAAYMRQFQAEYQENI